MPSISRQGTKMNMGTTGLNVDVESLPDIECLGLDCGGKLFREALRLKKLSAIASPNGQESIVPIMTMVCIKCNTPVDLS